VLRPIGDLIHQRTPAFELTKAAVLALSDGERVFLKAWIAKYIAANGAVLRPNQPSAANNTSTRRVPPITSYGKRTPRRGT
jgi:hypothetical protein